MATNFQGKWGDVVRIKADTANRQYFQPDVAASEKERDPIWFADNIKYICTYYDCWANILLTSRMGSNTGGNPAGANQGSTDSTMWGIPGETPVQHMVRMMTYYNGWQPNIDYAHLTKNVTTTNLMPSWIRSQKVFSVVNVMKDVMSQMLANVGFDIENLTEQAQSTKKEMLDKLMIQYEMKDYMGQLADLGINIDSAQGKNFDLPEDVQRFVTEDYKDIDSTVMMSIADHLWSCYDLTDKYLQMWVHSRTAGRCGFEHQVVNGTYRPNVWMPYELIVDNRVDDDYNRKAMFVGTIKYYTPEQIFVIWPQMLSYKEEVNEMARESTNGLPYNTMSNLTWWYYSGSQQRGMVACVTGYWKTIRPDVKKKEKTAYGDDHYRPLRDGEAGGEELEDWMQGTIIGNRWLTDYGYRNNVIENFYDKSKVESPIKIFLPNMNLGESRSQTSRISQLVDEYEAIRFKIREMIGKSKGKVYFVKGWKFGNSANQKVISQDLSSIGMHVLTHSGEAEDFRGEEGNVLEMMDMTLDPNIDKLSIILNMINQEILEVGKISLTSLGNDQVQKYMGLGVQQNAMQAGSGSSSEYTQFMNWIQMNMQYGIDLNKYLLTEGDEEKAELIVGKLGVQYLKISKSIRYQNPLLTLKIAPFITSEQRARLLQMADRMASQDKLDYLDYLEIEMATTVPALYKDIRWGIKKSEMKADKEKAMEQMLQQLSEQNKQLHQENMMLQGEHGKNVRQTQGELHKKGMALQEQDAQQAPTSIQQ